MKEITEQEAFLRLSAQCAQAEHCQFEMLEKMRRWGVTEEAQARVMARLVGGRFVDDERFTRAFVSDKIKYNGWGRRKIEQALWAKGIDAALQQRVLDAVSEQEYLDVLRPLLKQKARSLKFENDFERQMKLMRFAQSRGFSIDEIQKALDAVP